MGGRVFSWTGDQLVNERRRGEGEKTVWRKRFKVDGGIEVENEIWTFCPSGSFPFLRKAMLDDVLNATGSHYDEAFETGWEDADLFFRMHLRGWKCLFTPRTFGWHVSSGSVGGNSTFLSKKLNYQTRVLRNRYFTMIKNLPRPMLLRLAPYLVAAEIALVPYFVLRSPKSLLALGSAYWQVLKSFPSLLNKRRIVQRNRTVPPMYLQQFFAGF
jgi:GT2 family glycosyltransferase